MAKKKSFWNEVQSDLKKFFSATKKQAEKGIRKYNESKKPFYEVTVKNEDDKYADRPTLLKTQDLKTARQKAKSLSAGKYKAGKYSIFIHEENGRGAIFGYHKGKESKY